MKRNTARLKRVLWWTLFAVVLILTVYLSSQNGPGSASVSDWLADKLWPISNGAARRILGHGVSYDTFHFYTRKLAHFLIHFVLAFTTFRASAWSFPQRKDAVRFALIFSVCLAIFDEAIQLVAPGRVSAFLDASINLSGVLIGAFFSSRLGPNRPRHTS